MRREKERGEGKKGGELKGGRKPSFTLLPPLLPPFFPSSFPPSFPPSLPLPFPLLSPLPFPLLSPFPRLPLPLPFPLFPPPSQQYSSSIIINIISSRGSSTSSTSDACAFVEEWLSSALVVWTVMAKRRQLWGKSIQDHQLLSEEP